MVDKKRCEPPEHLRDKDRLVCWLRRSDDEQMLAIWRTGPVPFWNIFDSDSECLPDGWLAFEGWRFYTTVTTPDTVAALVEALVGLMRWHLNEEAIYRMGLHPAPAKAAYEAARAALALYRGEAGR